MLRPKVDKKTRGYHHILSVGWTLVPSCSYGNSVRKTGIIYGDLFVSGTCSNTSFASMLSFHLTFRGNVNQRTQEPGVFWGDSQNPLSSPAERRDSLLSLARGLCSHTPMADFLAHLGFSWLTSSAPLLLCGPFSHLFIHCIYLNLLHPSLASSCGHSELKFPCQPQWQGLERHYVLPSLRWWLNEKGSPITLVLPHWQGFMDNKEGSLVAYEPHPKISQE